MQKITVPDIGDVKDVKVIEVLIHEGDKLSKEDSIITLESEKASMEVPSPEEGIVKELKIKVGDTVSQGDIILILDKEATSFEAKNNGHIKSVEEEIPKKVEPAPQKQASSNQQQPQEQIVKVPDIGNFEAVPIIEVNVKEGDQVNLEDPLITLESEKASMEIPSTFKGTIKQLKVKLGDKVSQGDEIALISTGESVGEVVETQEQSQKVEIKSQEQVTAPVTAQESKAVTSSKVHAGPGTRRLARMLGVDLTNVTGSGRKGRIVILDVHQHVKNILSKGVVSGSGLGVAPMPKIDFTKYGEIEVQPIKRIKKLTAKNMHRNWVSLPHVTQFNDADITELENFRKENKQQALDMGIKLTPLPFIIEAIVSALKKYPQFNSSLSEDGEQLIVKKYYHIGVAADTPNGLVVPVLKDADSKGLFQIAREVRELGEQAKEGKLTSSQMQGQTFTISSLGAIGGKGFTPIINAPDVAILGVSKASIKPIYINGEFVPRLMLPLALSYDHRVIDGVEAGKFISHICEKLQDIRKLLL